MKHSVEERDGLGTSGLMALSAAYQSKVHYYQKFAEAEDKRGAIATFLTRFVAGKDVLDIGCGTGKYLRLLSPLACSYYGIDRAPDTLSCVGGALGVGGRVSQADARRLPFRSDSFDCALACWVFGTMPDWGARLEALQEAMRALRPDGELLLVENDEGGMFEWVRGRYPLVSRTRQYNEFLEACGARVAVRLSTSFEFESLGEAREVFEALWGARVGERVQTWSVGHRVVIYRLRRDWFCEAQGKYLPSRALANHG